MAFAAAERETHNPAFAKKQTPAAAVSADIVKLNKTVRKLKEMSDKLGTAKDNMKFRRKLKKQREQASADAKAIKTRITALKESGAKKSTLSRIMKDLKSVVDAYQKVSKQSQLRERQIVLAKEASVRMPASDIESGEAKRAAAASKVEEEERKRDSAGPGGELASGLRGVNVAILSEVDLEIMREREAEAAELATDAAELQDMFQDLGNLVAAQGDDLNLMEKNIDSTQAHVEKGIEHLEVAEIHQKSYRKKLCCVAIVGLILLLAILIPTLIHFLK